MRLAAALHFHFSALGAQNRWWRLLVLAAGAGLLFWAARAVVIGNLGATLLAPPSARSLAPLARIAHAGGMVDGATYTNSLEALNANAAHYSLFELDFNFTADHRLVCIHNWPTRDNIPTRAAFLQAQTGAVHHNCTIESLVGWLAAHPGKRIVTDVKDDNVEALRYIAEHYPDYKNRFIPQIYFPHEYRPVRALGYRDIIWTLYRYRWGGIFVLSQARTMHLFAVTMPVKRAQGLPRLLRRLGIASYVHTIDDPAQWATLKQFGVGEIYTDTLFAH